MSVNDPSAADPFGQIADEFVEALRQGKRPSVEEFARRYPEHADEIRDMLPALALMEKAKSADDPSAEPSEPRVSVTRARLEKLGDYQILREVGRGGMGVVYEAQQLSLGRHVAIKVLPAHALFDLRHLGRFQREARSAAKLHHTNIVPVFGVGEHDGLHYYVMQFIQGLGLDVVLDELRRLRQLPSKPAPTRGGAPGRPTNVARDVSAVHVARGLVTGEFRQPGGTDLKSVPPEPAIDLTTAPGEKRDEGGGMRHEKGDSSLLPPPSSLSSSAVVHLPGQKDASTLSESGSRYWQSVARVGMQVADALAHAASQGVLHRDIKPSNLLLDDTGNVWVTDFGLAKATTDGDNLTNTGDVVGTMRYMAPERFNGQGDLRSDVYSLGLTLYELLTLRPAFDEADRNKLVKQVMHDEPVRPRKLNRRVPSDLETVVLKAIARDPAHRYQTPGDLAEDLKRFVEDRPVRARRVSEAEKLWRWCRRNPLPASLVAGIVLVFLAGFAGVFWQWRGAETARADEKSQRDRAEQSQKETADALAVVASQKTAVESSLTKAEKAEQVARAAEETGRKLLYATDMKLAPFVWKDPQATAAQLRQRLDAHNPARNKSLAGKDDLRGFEWYYFQHLLEHSSTVLNAGGGEKGTGSLNSKGPVPFSPTAAVIDFALADDGPLVTLDQQGRLKQWDPDTHRQMASRDSGLAPFIVPAVPQAGRKRQPKALSPDGRRVASAVGKTVRVQETTTGVVLYQLEAPAAVWDLIFSPDDRFLVTHDGRRSAWFDAANGQPVAHFDQAITDFHIIRPELSLSADGLTLAVWAQGNIGNLVSIFHLDPTAKKVTLPAGVPDNRGSISTAALSPDGRLIAVGHIFRGRVNVYDTGTSQEIAVHDSAHASPISAIAFSRNGQDIVTGDAEGLIKTWGDARKLTSKSEPQQTLKGHGAAITKVAFSGTGEQLVSASQDGTVRLWELGQAHSATRRLQASYGDPVFLAGGRLIATAEGNRVTIWDAASGQRLRSLAEGGQIISLAVSPDNRLLAVGRYTETGPLPPFHPSYLSLWELDTGRRLAQIFDREEEQSYHSAYTALETLAFSPDGKFLVGGFGTRMSHFSHQTIDLRVWEVATLREHKRLVGHTNACVSVCFSADGTRMASGSHDGTARIWDTATWQAVGGPLTVSDGEVGYNPVEAVAFSPDGGTLAVAMMSGRILLWNLKTRDRTALPRAHANAVNCVTFSPDGRTLASGSSDGTIRIWNVATGRDLMILNSRDLSLGDVRSLSFSPDGTQLLARGMSATGGSAVVWSAAPSVWENPTLAANQLKPLLRSPAEFQSRVRMWSEIPQLREALEALASEKGDATLNYQESRPLFRMQVRAALAATRANWHATHRRWPDAAREHDRLQKLSSDGPQAWLRTPGLIRVATALLQEGRPAQAAALLTGGATRRTQDGLPPVKDIMFGFGYQKTGDLIRITQLVPGSPAARSKLQMNDVLLKINDVAVSDVAVSEIAGIVKREAGFRVRLTVRHPKDDRTDVIELSRADPESEELWRPLLASIEAGLAKNPRDAGLLELRAELAGQWSGFADQVRDYTAAIDAPATLPKEQVKSDLQRLYRRRGDAHFHLRQWQAAVDDYARGVTAESRDAALLSRRAEAYEHLRNWRAASTEWTRALEGNPDAGRLHAAFATRLGNANQFELASSHRKKAERCFEAQLAREPENAALAAELAEVLLQESASVWTVLKPSEMRSAGGATLTLLADGSIRSGGKHPNRDDYIIRIPTEVKTIRAIALDALPYGRGEFGQSAITGFEVSRLDASGRQQPVALNHAVADVEPMEVWATRTAQSVLDGRDDGSGWLINPLFRPHRLVVRPEQALAADTTALVVVIRQHHFGDWAPQGLLLGRFRLSVSDDPDAFEREQRRFAARKLTEPWAMLGAAYALNGREPPASASFARALARTHGYEARKPILEFVARFDTVLAALVQRQPDDPQLQLALARKLAERGKHRLAEKQPAAAQADLQEAREILTRLRAQRPEPRWTVLTPTAMTSEMGTTLTLQADGSVLAGGANPYADTYTLTAPIAGGPIAGLRLETIPDARLPGGGAGRGDNTGGFVLSEVEAALQIDGAGDLPLVIQDGCADFSRDNQPIAHAFDSNSVTRWGVFPQLTTPHTAVFLFGPYPTEHGARRKLTIRLWCGGEHWDRQNLGRFRLSVTNDAEALRAARLRNDLKDSEADLNLALAKAHAQQGHMSEAVASFTEALDLTADRASKARVIAEAAPLEGVLERLADRAAGDAQFQAELARRFAQRGKNQLADAARARARALFEARLAKEPENSGLAAELAQLLLDQREADMASRWTVLKPVEAKSELGATLSILPEHSILASGDNPLNDRYRVVLAVGTDIKLAAVRLEALTHDSLPRNGPGRHATGNFAQTSWKVTATLPDRKDRIPLEFDKVLADQRYQWPIQSNGHLNIYGGGEGRDCLAFWATSKGISLVAGTQLIFEMQFKSADGNSENLGRFRLSISGDPASLDEEQKHFTALKLTDPWAKLAAAYHVIGDRQALDTLVKHHPEAASGIGDLYAASQDWERAIAEYRKAVTDQHPDVALLTKLATAYQSAGRAREAVPYLAQASALNPKDTLLSLDVAARQAWFGQEKDLAATRHRILAFARDTNDAGTAEHAAKACSIRASTDNAERDAALALARKGVQLAPGGDWLEWRLLALGMAEYRSGNYAAAGEALLAAAKAGPNNAIVTGIASFYRAMSLFRQGRPEEARKLALAAAAEMKPLPKDEQNPLANNAYWDDLILWLVYKEAKAMIKLDVAPPQSASDKK